MLSGRPNVLRVSCRGRVWDTRLSWSLAADDSCMRLLALSHLRILKYENSIAWFLSDPS